MWLYEYPPRPKLSEETLLSPILSPASVPSNNDKFLEILNPFAILVFNVKNWLKLLYAVALRNNSPQVLNKKPLEGKKISSKVSYFRVVLILKKSLFSIWYFVFWKTFERDVLEASISKRL